MPSNSDDVMADVPRSPARGRLLSRRSVLAAVLVVSALGVLVLVASASWGDQLMQLLVQQEAHLRQWQEASPRGLFAIAFAAYVLACFVPGTNGKAFLSGWLFGILGGTVLINGASMIAAFLMFYLARYALRSRVEAKYAGRLEGIRESIRRDGGAYLFALRVVPVVPYSVLNALMGVSPMRARTFWWATQLGILPSNVAFAWAGASLPGLRDLQAKPWTELISWQLFAALLLLALLAALARRILRVGLPTGWSRRI